MLEKLDVLDKSSPYSPMAAGDSDDERPLGGKDHQSDSETKRDISNVEMSDMRGTPESYVTSVELRSDAGSSDTPLRKFIRTASGKLSVQEIDKGLHKVFVSPQ